MSIATFPEPKDIISAERNGYPHRFHWTVKTFYRAIDAGVFDEPNRLELIAGDLIRKEPMNPPHALTVSRIVRLLRSHLEPRLCVREEKPVHFDFDGEPVPDISVVDGTDEDYALAHPGPEQIKLLIEVAHSTVNYDTGEKAALYAMAGVMDYWAVLLEQRQIKVFRAPSERGYPEPVTYHEGDTISPLCEPSVSFPVSQLLPRGTQ